MKPTRVIMLLLIASLVMPAYGAEPEVELGYSPSRLFESWIGSPTYMPNESIWIKVHDTTTIRLLDPAGRIAASTKPLRSTPWYLYTFKQSDPLGLWIVEVAAGGGVKRIPIRLEDSKLEAEGSGPFYRLSGDSLIIEGVLTPKNVESHEGGALLLVEKAARNVTITAQSATSLGESPIYVEIVQTSYQPQTITLKPFTGRIESSEEFSGELVVVSGVGWAELQMDVPLIKTSTPRTTVHIHETVVKTPIIPLTLTSTPNQTITLKLPSLNEVGWEGSAPLRVSRITLVFNFRVADVTYAVRSEFYYVPSIFRRHLASHMEVEPHATAIPYNFTQSLTGLSEYELLLLLRINGVYKVWSCSLTPPVAQLNVYNQFERWMDMDKLDDYMVEFYRGVAASVNVAGDTFILLERSPVATGYELTVGGVRLHKGDAQPKEVTLEITRKTSLTVGLSKVAFTVTDSSGRPIPSGLLTISRALSEAYIRVAELEWSEPGALNVTLPRGCYEAAVKIDRYLAMRSFQVNRSSLSVDIRVEGFKIPSVDETAQSMLLYVNLAIIGAEGVAAVHVWRRALRTKSR